MAEKAVLLSFRLADNGVISGGYSRFYDKVPMKYADYSEDDFKMLEVSRRTVIRRWQSACLLLHDRMQGEMP